MVHVANLATVQMPSVENPQKISAKSKLIELNEKEGKGQQRLWARRNSHDFPPSTEAVLINMVIANSLQTGDYRDQFDEFLCV